MENRFNNFLTNWKLPYLEDSVLWYALDNKVDYYLDLSIHDRINFKQSYFQEPTDKNSPWKH